MKPAMLYALIGALLLGAASCGEPAGVGELMGTLPTGYNLYLTFRPDEVGMDRILPSLGEIGAASRTDPGALGFDPFDWEAWREHLALSPGGEIGLVLAFESGEAVLVALYIPSEDPEAVEALFSGLAESEEDFDGEIGFLREGDCTVAVRARTGEMLEAFLAGQGQALSTDPEFAHLRGEAGGAPAAVRLYATSGAIPDETGLEGLLLTCGAEGAVLALQLLVDLREETAGAYSRLLAAGPSGADVRIPEGLGAAVRISLDMEVLGGLLDEGGFARGLGQMLPMLGMSSVADLLDLFSGDLYFGVRRRDGVYTGVLEIALRDPAGTERLLSGIQAMAVAGESAMETFEVGGRTCYRMETPEEGGMANLEIGILGEALVISGGIALTETAEGRYFQSFVEENGLGIANDGGMVFVTDSRLFRSMFGDGSAPGVGEALDGIDGLAGSLRLSDGLFELNLSLGTTGGSPFGVLADAVSGLVLRRGSEAPREPGR